MCCLTWISGLARLSNLALNLNKYLTVLLEYLDHFNLNSKDSKHFREPRFALEYVTWARACPGPFLAMLLTRMIHVMVMII